MMQFVPSHVTEDHARRIKPLTEESSIKTSMEYIYSLLLWRVGELIQTSLMYARSG